MGFLGFENYDKGIVEHITTNIEGDYYVLRLPTLADGIKIVFGTNENVLQNLELPYIVYRRTFEIDTTRLTGWAGLYYYEKDLNTGKAYYIPAGLPINLTYEIQSRCRYASEDNYILMYLLGRFGGLMAAGRIEVKDTDNEIHYAPFELQGIDDITEISDLLNIKHGKSLTLAVKSSINIIRDTYEENLVMRGLQLTLNKK